MSKWWPAPSHSRTVTTKPELRRTQGFSFTLRYDKVTCRYNSTMFKASLVYHLCFSLVCKLFHLGVVVLLAVVVVVVVVVVVAVANGFWCFGFPQECFHPCLPCCALPEHRGSYMLTSCCFFLGGGEWGGGGGGRLALAWSWSFSRSGKHVGMRRVTRASMLKPLGCSLNASGHHNIQSMSQQS